MSVMGMGAPGGPGTDGHQPRVRELAREAVAVMAFSAAVSVGTVLAIVAGLGR